MCGWTGALIRAGRTALLGYSASIKWFRQFENALRVGIPALRRMGIVMEIAVPRFDLDQSGERPLRVLCMPGTYRAVGMRPV